MTLPKPNINTFLVPICTFVILGAIAWVGKTSSETHDAAIRMETKQAQTEKDVSEIKGSMMNRNDLQVELLKLQIPQPKK